MIETGAVLDIAAMGARVEIRRSAAETGGELVELDVVGRPFGLLVQPHVHTRSVEHYEVIAGTMRLVAGRREHLLRAGESFDTPAGVAHRQIPGSDDEGRVRIQVRPAASTEAFLARLAELSATGQVNRWGFPRPLAGAQLVLDFADDGHAARPPVRAQRALARALVRAASREYLFVDEWDVAAPRESVFEALADAQSYPDWWTPVYIDVDSDGPPAVGSRSRQHFKGRLPYHLHTSSTITRMEPPHALEADVEGDLSGHGAWTLSETAGGTHVRFDWRVTADRALLRALSPVLRPALRWNHAWAIARAIEGLEPYAQRLATTARERVTARRRAVVRHRPVVPANCGWVRGWCACRAVEFRGVCRVDGHYDRQVVPPPGGCVALTANTAVNSYHPLRSRPRRPLASLPSRSSPGQQARPGKPDRIECRVCPPVLGGQPGRGGVEVGGREDHVVDAHAPHCPARALGSPAMSPAQRRARRRSAPETPVRARDGEVLVWTDGACRGNPGPGGWAAIVVRGDAPPLELSGGAAQTTNNRMEYTAALEGLRALPEGSSVCIVTDSRLMLESMTKWIAGWKRKGWRTAGGEPVKNQDLVRALEAEIARHAVVRWHWVRGHETGAEHAHKALNDRADRLAVAASHAAA